MAPSARESVELELAERRPVAAGTMAFRFIRPANFEFKAGQSADFTIVEPIHADGGDLTHTYSISSSPDNRETIMITTRMRDTSFKDNLRDMPIGSLVEATRPSGKFTLPEDRRPVVMLAGGIGITPFRSMLKHMVDTRQKHSVTLFYSNPTPEETTFLDELEDWQGKIGLKLVVTATREAPGSWPHHRGRIDAAMVRRELSERQMEDALFYVAGPPKMVDAMAAILREADVTEDRILRDEFTGY